MTYIPNTGHFVPKIDIDPRHYYVSRKDQFIYSGSGVGDDGDHINEWIDSGRVGGKNFLTQSLGTVTFKEMHASNSQPHIFVSRSNFGRNDAELDTNWLHNGKGSTVGLIFHANPKNQTFTPFAAGGANSTENGFRWLFNSGSDWNPLFRFSNGTSEVQMTSENHALVFSTKIVCMIFRMRARTNTETNSSDPNLHEIELRIGGQQLMGHILPFDPSNAIAGRELHIRFGEDGVEVSYFEVFMEDSYLGDNVVEAYERYAIDKYNAAIGTQYER